MSGAVRNSLVVLKMPSGAEMNSGRHMRGCLKAPGSQDRIIDALHRGRQSHSHR